MSKDDTKNLKFALPATGDRVTTKIKREDRLTKCEHRALELDESKRKVWCKQCGDYIDPFDGLKAYALWETELDWKIKEYEKFLWESKQRDLAKAATCQHRRKHPMMGMKGENNGWWCATCNHRELPVNKQLPQRAAKQ